MSRVKRTAIRLRLTKFLMRPSKSSRVGSTRQIGQLSGDQLEESPVEGGGIEPDKCSRSKRASPVNSVIRASRMPAISVIQPWRSNLTNTVARPNTDHGLVQGFYRGIRGVAGRTRRGFAPPAGAGHCGSRRSPIAWRSCAFRLCCRWGHRGPAAHPDIRRSVVVDVDVDTNAQQRSVLSQGCRTPPAVRSRFEVVERGRGLVRVGA